MSDIASNIEVQRGLGSSRLAISSVGGTVNIVTKVTDLYEGGLFKKTVFGSNGFYKTSFAYNTGLMEKVCLFLCFLAVQGLEMELNGHKVKVSYFLWRV